MKKTKTLVTVSLFLLIAVVGLGTTLAYLSDKSGTLKNTFTFAQGIHMQLDEDKADPDTHKKISGQENTVIAGETPTGNHYDNILPGEDLDKDPTVTIMKNSPDCYVFVAVQNPSDTLLSLNIGSKWKKVEEDPTKHVVYYVYTSDGTTPAIVPASTKDQRLEEVFTKVHVAEQLPEGATVEDIIIKSSAIQSKVNGVDAYDTVKTEGLGLLKSAF